MRVIGGFGYCLMGNCCRQAGTMPRPKFPRPMMPLLQESTLLSSSLNFFQGVDSYRAEARSRVEGDADTLIPGVKNAGVAREETLVAQVVRFCAG